MILVIYGTTGELIKLAPVLRRLEARGASFVTATTAQQAAQIPTFLDDLGLRAPDAWLARGSDHGDLQHRSEVPGWLWACTASVVRRRRTLLRRLRDGNGLVLVHGDTMTTVFGAAVGRAAGVPVAHIEAGLRSGSIREPFPEELDRRITSRLAAVHFAPGAWAVDNLRRAGVRGDVVDTGGNTVGDAIRDSPPTEVDPSIELPLGRFGIVSLHREELLRDPELLRATAEALSRASQDVPLLFVDHSITVAAFTEAGLDGIFDERLRRIPRLPHRAFIAVAQRAGFLITDSGGSQEECTALGIPCLVHRRRTERLDGLAEGLVELTRFDVSAIERFVSAQRSRVTRSHTGPVGEAPSDVIVSWLLERGYGAN